MSKRILFLSWQGGLGHITRDLAIAAEIQRQEPDVEIAWLAHPLAGRLITEAGGRLLPEAAESADYNRAGLEASHGEFRLNLIDYIRAGRSAWRQNVRLFNRVTSIYPFDLIIGDECYEIVRGVMAGQVKLRQRLLFIQDFLGVEATTGNPLEHFIAWHLNWQRIKRAARIPPEWITEVFAGEPQDIPDRPFGFWLENRRRHAARHLQFVGYILRFDPAACQDRAALRRRLGYGKGPLLICATGGTGIGKELIELCGRAIPVIRAALPDLQVVMVCGDLAGRRPPAVPAEVSLHEYVPNLYEHYAACDCAVVVGGGTTTLELTALRRPFIYFPLAGHFDQEHCVAERLARQRAGVRMTFSGTSPEILAKTILAHLGREVSWTAIPVDGARRAARLVLQNLNRQQRR